MPAVKNPQDWAIVVGIASYPGFQNHDLPGAINDATSFHEWVTSDVGGGVDPAHAKLVLSPAPGGGTREPTQDAIERELLNLQDLATAKRDAGENGPVGRRLYLYFSGHGFAPTTNETAFLAANAEPKRPGYNIPGRAWAELFSLAGWFGEVVLIMDCCRESLPLAPLRAPPINAENDGDAIKNRRWFYAFATKWTMVAKECTFTVDGKPVRRGVFTHALLQALRGNAADNNGQITAYSLSSWLYGNMKTFLTQAQIDDPEVPTEPAIDTDSGWAGRFVLVPPAAPIAPAGGAGAPAGPPPAAGAAPEAAAAEEALPASPAGAAPTFTVRFRVGASRVGKPLVVDQGEGTASEAFIEVATPEWAVPLTRGLYQVRCPADGLSKPFEVRGTGEEDVDV